MRPFSVHLAFHSWLFAERGPFLTALPAARRLPLDIPDVFRMVLRLVGRDYAVSPVRFLRLFFFWLERLPVF